MNGDTDRERIAPSNRELIATSNRELIAASNRATGARFAAPIRS